MRCREMIAGVQDEFRSSETTMEAYGLSGKYWHQLIKSQVVLLSYTQRYMEGDNHGHDST